MSVFTSKKLKGVYRFDFWHGGQRFHGSTGCTTRKEAIKVEDAEREKAKAAVKAQAKLKASLALGDVIGRYWDIVGQHHAGADTTERDLNRLVDYFGENKLLTDIHDADVTALVAWRRGQPIKSHKKEKKVSSESRRKGCVDVNTPKLVANATINRSTTEVLKKLFTFCKRKERVRFEDEPDWKDGGHFLPESDPKKHQRELKPSQAVVINEAMRDDFAPIFAFVQATGWRQGAAVTLQWDEVDLENGGIKKEGKGEKTIELTITPAIRAILEPLVGHHPTAVFTYICQKTRKDADGNMVMLRGKRYPMTQAGLKTRWRRTRDDAGITGFRFHDFRHTFATKLLRKTGNLRLVQDALNHADVTTTLRYAAVTKTDLAAAIEGLANEQATALAGAADNETNASPKQNPNRADAA
jgi:integrase